MTSSLSSETVHGEAPTQTNSQRPYIIIHTSHSDRICLVTPKNIANLTFCSWAACHSDFAYVKNALGVSTDCILFILFLLTACWNHHFLQKTRLCMGLSFPRSHLHVFQQHPGGGYCPSRIGSGGTNSICRTACCSTSCTLARAATWNSTQCEICNCHDPQYLKSFPSQTNELLDDDKHCTSKFNKASQFVPELVIETWHHVLQSNPFALSMPDCEMLLTNDQSILKAWPILTTGTKMSFGNG